MQTLKWNDVHEAEQKREYPIPPQTEGVDVTIKIGSNGPEVILILGDKNYSMSVSGARDLALALRQTANKIERGSR